MLVIAPNVIIQQNICMIVYIKSKWFNNSPYFVLQDIAYLDVKAQVLSFTPTLCGVPVHKVWLLFVAFAQNLHCLIWIMSSSFMLIP